MTHGDSEIATASSGGGGLWTGRSIRMELGYGLYTEAQQRVAAQSINVVLALRE
jgi:hypothetical protein